MDAELEQIRSLIINKVKSSPECIDTLMKLLTATRDSIIDNNAVAKMRRCLLSNIEAGSGDYEWLDRILTNLFESYSHDFQRELENNDGMVFEESANHYFDLCDNSISIDYDVHRDCDEVTISSSGQHLFYKYYNYREPECEFYIGRKTRFTDVYDFLTDKLYPKACELFTGSPIWEFIIDDIKKVFPQSQRKSISEHLAEHRDLDIQIINKNPKLDEQARVKLLVACNTFYDSLVEKVSNYGSGLGIDYTQIKWDMFKEYEFMADGIMEVDEDIDEHPEKILDFIYTLTEDTAVMRLDTLFIYSGIKQFFINIFSPDYETMQKYEDDETLIEVYKNKELESKYPSSIIHYVNHNLQLLVDDSQCDAGLQSMLKPVIVPILFRIMNYVISYKT